MKITTKFRQLFSPAIEMDHNPSSQFAPCIYSGMRLFPACYSKPKRYTQGAEWDSSPLTKQTFIPQIDSLKSNSRYLFFVHYNASIGEYSSPPYSCK